MSYIMSKKTPVVKIFFTPHFRCGTFFENTMHALSKRNVLPRKELPGYLSLSLRTVDTLLKEGVLPKIRLSKRRIGVLKTDVDAYIQRNRQNAAE